MIAEQDASDIKKLTGIALPGRDGCFDLSIDGGTITAIEKATGAPRGLLALPPFYEPHVHANRAYQGSVGNSPSLQQAIADSLEDRRSATAEIFAQRAARLFQQALENGVQTLRTHTDVDDLAELSAIQGTLAAMSNFADRLTVEIVAFATSRLDPASAAGSHLLQQAVDLGANLLGAVPAFYPAPQKSIDRLLELTAANGLMADFHLDEHLDGNNSLSDYLIDATVRFGLQGKVSLSHGCALATLPAKQARRIIDKLAAAQITVITLPATNLYVQDRNQDQKIATPRRRGITLVREFVEAGVNVLIGSDNVRDYFYPYGNADPLESAFLASLAGHLDDPATLLKGICNGRATIEVGDCADCVLLPVADAREALATRPGERQVIRHGKIVV